MQTPKTYILKSKNYTYVVKMGTTKALCVYITVNIKYEKDIPHIEGLHYEKECAVNNLQKKSGTIDMINAALAFVCKKFPYVKSFTFKDTSYISCKYKKTIPLASYYHAKYGQTWYQRHLHAKPFLEKTQELLQRINTELASRYKETFDRFWNANIEPFRGSFSKNMDVDAFKERLREFWDTNTTYREFFHDITASYIDCFIFNNWLQAYYYNLGLSSDIIWQIHKDSININDIQIEKSTEYIKVYEQKGGSSGLYGWNHTIGKYGVDIF